LRRRFGAWPPAGGRAQAALEQAEALERGDAAARAAALDDGEEPEEEDW
jgi:hypothetical protein